MSTSAALQAPATAQARAAVWVPTLGRNATQVVEAESCAPRHVQRGSRLWPRSAATMPLGVVGVQLARATGAVVVDVHAGEYMFCVFGGRV